MSEISPQGYSVAHRPVPARFAGLAEQEDRLQSDPDSRTVEQATGAISARLGTTTDVAFEILSGLARSQGRKVEEYAKAVLANRGLLGA
jgi:AmiR/NasT family two-component response regulator